MRERLFQHHQIELVQLLKQRHVGKFVSRIGITHQTYFGKLFAHAFDNLEVPTRFDLDFDALITCVNFLANLFEQNVGRILNTDRHATRNL